MNIVHAEGTRWWLQCSASQNLVLITTIGGGLKTILGHVAQFTPHRYAIVNTQDGEFLGLMYHFDKKLHLVMSHEYYNADDDDFYQEAFDYYMENEIVPTLETSFNKVSNLDVTNSILQAEKDALDLRRHNLQEQQRALVEEFVNLQRDVDKLGEKRQVFEEQGGINVQDVHKKTISGLQVVGDLVMWEIPYDASNDLGYNMTIPSIIVTADFKNPRNGSARKIRFYTHNQTQAALGDEECPVPHVINSKIKGVNHGACFGNYTDEVKEATNKGNLEYLLELMTRFVRSVNTADAAGAHYHKWQGRFTDIETPDVLEVILTEEEELNAMGLSELTDIPVAPAAPDVEVFNVETINRLYGHSIF